MHFAFEKKSRLPGSVHVSVTDWFQYPDYQNYYGPSSLCHVFRFCQLMDAYAGKRRKREIVVYCDRFDEQRANSLFLLGAFMIVRLDYTVPHALTRLHPVLGSVPSFRTEGAAPPDVFIEMSDCLRALERALRLGWLNCFQNMKTKEINEDFLTRAEDLEDPANGDISWIIPNRLIAMAGPLLKSDKKSMEWTPDLPVVMAQLESMNVSCIVRLNRKHYEQSDIAPVAITVHEMFLHDGSVPANDQTVADFQKIVKEAWDRGTAVAVHCRAGLGRTGTFIGTCLIDWFGFTAKEAIAYLRMARPGSVLGDQPLFLQNYELKNNNGLKQVDAKKGKHGPKLHHRIPFVSNNKRIKTENKY